MKTCSSCKVEKPTTEFYQSKVNKDGLRSSCKGCIRVQQKKWRKANPEKNRARIRRYRGRNKHAIAERRLQNREKINARSREGYWKNVEERRAKARNRAAAELRANPEKVKQRRLRWKAANPNWRREYMWKRSGIPPETAREVINRARCCEICGRDTKLVPDHDHSTGKVRGALCNNCNLGIGYFKDDPRLLASASAYLVVHAKEADPPMVLASTWGV